MSQENYDSEAEEQGREYDWDTGEFVDSVEGKTEVSATDGEWVCSVEEMQLFWKWLLEQFGL